ncbi:MAG: serine hydrolase [Siphonobacter aquaeclarae]|nr:serine hydrolase [Siphonobacter aquaeclarae]
MKKALLLLLLSCSAFAQKPRKQTDRFAGLDTAFNRALKDWKAAGFAVAVVEKGQVVYAKGFGYRDVNKKLPVTPQTLFAIGSCTKAFTSSLVGLLEKEGKVDLDKPAHTYLPELTFAQESLTKQVTLRDMMCHRTGLPRYDLSWYLNAGSRDSLLARIAFMEPTAPLRQTWQYNNFMFLAQGSLTEKLWGKSWEDNVREKLFQPLAMNTSGFSLADFRKSTDASLGYAEVSEKDTKPLDYYPIVGMGPAGSINSNVLDMAQWLRLWIAGGKLDGKEILPAGYVREAMSPQMTMGGGVPDKSQPGLSFSDYGFGWMLSSYKGHYRVEHGGNIDGFSASTSFFPTDSLGIVVLSNQSNSAVPGIIRNLIADRLLKLGYQDWNGARLAVIRKARKDEESVQSVDLEKKGTRPSHAAADYTGNFHSGAFGTFQVLAKGDSLFLQTRREKFWLRHKQYDVFQPISIRPKIDTTDKGSIRLQFQTGVTGDIESFLGYGLEAADKPFTFTRVPVVQQLTADDLKKYTGEFLLAGMTIKSYIKNDHTLYLFVPGQPEYELASTGKDQFKLIKLDGYSARFEVPDGKEAASVTFIQPNGNFKAVRKTK